MLSARTRVVLPPRVGVRGFSVPGQGPTRQAAAVFIERRPRHLTDTQTSRLSMPPICERNGAGADPIDGDVRRAVGEDAAGRAVWLLALRLFEWVGVPERGAGAGAGWAGAEPPSSQVERVQSYP